MKRGEETEVTKEQYDVLKTKLSGVVFHRTEGEKYFIKVHMEKYFEQVKTFLGK